VVTEKVVGVIPTICSTWVRVNAQLNASGAQTTAEMQVARTSRSTSARAVRSRPW